MEKKVLISKDVLKNILGKYTIIKKNLFGLSLICSSFIFHTEAHAFLNLNINFGQPDKINNQILSSKAIHISATKTKGNYAQTKYPLVLAHGFALGFSRLGTEHVGLDQFYQITPDLARNGASVFVAQMSPVASTAVRGEQLLNQVEEVIALTGQQKVNLIGHSHGGTTVRYIEGVAPNKVASITAIAGTHKGSPGINGVLNNKALNTVGKVTLSYILAPALAALQNDPNLPIDYDGAMYDLSVEGSEAFNKKFPSAAVPQNCEVNGEKLTGNGVYHYSWIGNSQVTNLFDIVDTAIVIGVTALMPGERNHDGLVPVCSAKYGHVVRNNYNLNHFDEINQFLGLKSGFAQDPVQIFREHANRLQVQGL